MGNEDGSEDKATDTGLEPGGVGGPSPHYVTGWLDVITEHINEHLRIYRTVSWVVGSVGMILLLRFSRAPIRQFHQVADIPADYVVGNRKLSGVVMTTGWNTIGVWHVPPWRRVLRYRTEPPKECPDKDLLTVQFSGVSIGNPKLASAWLRETLLGRKVWLKLLDHTSQAALDQKAIQCAVYIRKKGLLRWRKSCINEGLLVSGVGSVTDVKGFAKNADHADFVSGLIKSERAAKTRGKGVWQGTEHVTILNRIRNYFRSA